MPVLPPPATPSWRTAWDGALYGPQGFFRRHAPADHFRTAVHGSDVVARALLRLVEQHGLDTVVDVGAGRGELLVAMRALAPEVRLVAVEVAPRPDGLPDDVAWLPSLPGRLDGLVVAHEWLDNVPCHVVEVDRAGTPRLLHVDPATGVESLGHPVDAAGVPPSIARWLERWWPLEGPGSRAEVGTSRDRAWTDVVSRLRSGLALAVDYGHLREARPRAGTLRSYLRGTQVELLPDGSRDVTADVAVDAVAAAAGGTVLRQREALRSLGATGTRPPVSLSVEDPVRYAEALARAAAEADVTAAGGLGDFYWLLSGAGGVDPLVG
jgi:SAM-dependent MidA family methyltransferase